MSLEMIFSEDIQNTAEEVIANKILSYTDVDFDNVPVMIADVLRNSGFALGAISRFNTEDIAAGISYSEEEFGPLHSKKYFIFRTDLNVKDRRFLMALAISKYVYRSNNSYIAISLHQNELIESHDDREYRIARAILMPQKSLSTLVMSPLISKMDIREKVANVSKAFLVPTSEARTRMIETGLL